MYTYYYVHDLIDTVCDTHRYLDDSDQKKSGGRDQYHTRRSQ